MERTANTFTGREVIFDANGRYEFRSIVPSGYAVPPQGTTDQLLTAIGRHGNRPAHIHFFVTAAGHRHLTTQINIAGDKYMYDDFAFATREGLLPVPNRQGDSAYIAFDFAVQMAASDDDEGFSSRVRATA